MTTRDYSNMPKLEWKDHKGTLARVKNQLAHEEPVVLLMPAEFNFDLDADAVCQYDETADIYYDCAPNSVLSSLARQNSDSTLVEVGSVAEDAGLIVDVDPGNRQLIIHD